MTREEITEQTLQKRNEIIRLMETGEYNIKQIADKVGLSLSGIQRQIRLIKKDGIAWKKPYTKSPKRQLIHLAQLITTPGNAVRAIQFAKEVLSQ